ncbi:MAG TPA: ABC transporter permease, partial [Blastocatellia bacterium]|nr:ABC transporter permease [Blastocatellia bacterium]
MIKHLIKLVWNRKRANLLIGIEIFVSFLVLFAILVLVIYCIDNYRRPLGFNYEHVWNIEIEMKQEPAGQSPERAETMRQLYLNLKELNEIEAVAGAQYQPFTFGGNYGLIRNQAAEIRFRNNTVTDDFDRVLGVKLEGGRWFGRQDDGADPPSAVINRRLANEYFGAADPVGRVLESSDNFKFRVIGLVADFRHGGEFYAPENLVFLRQNANDPQARPERHLLIKLRPGTTRAFEERLVRRLQGAAPEWSFEVTPLTELRESLLQQTWIPMAAACVVAIFLMIMVALGLTGVLWQNVTQR